MDRLRARLKFEQHWKIHHLRKTFSTHLNERHPDQTAVIEACINHVSGDAKQGVAGTYNLASYWKQRVDLMNEWADLVDAVASGQLPEYNVVQLHAGVV
ncbi:MAG: hypothetical protein HOI45_03670 [Rhodospirillaceae bacterium]|nr:hypothetical protein [Rhodospirillaceae bacterium]